MVIAYTNKAIMHTWKRKYCVEKGASFDMDSGRTTIIPTKNKKGNKFSFFKVVSSLSINSSGIMKNIVVYNPWSENRVKAKQQVKLCCHSFFCINPIKIRRMVTIRFNLGNTVSTNSLFSSEKLNILLKRYMMELRQLLKDNPLQENVSVCAKFNNCSKNIISP